MKKIMKTDGIITNVFGPNTKVNNPRLRNPKMGNYAFISFKYKGNIITSKNTIGVSSNKENGDYCSVWIVDTKPEMVFSNPISAFLFG